MRGFPKTIGTKADLDNLRSMPKYQKLAEDKLKEIAASRFVWQKDKVLVDAKDGKTSDTLKVIVSQDADGKPEIIQMKLVEDATAQYFRLGYKNEIAAAIEDKI